MKVHYDIVKSIQCRSIVGVLTVLKRRDTYRSNAQLPVSSSLLRVPEKSPPSGTNPRSTPKGVISFDREYAAGYTAAITRSPLDHAERGGHVFDERANRAQ